MKNYFFCILILIFSCQISLGMDAEYLRDLSPMRVDTPRASSSRVLPSGEEGSTSGRVSSNPLSSAEVEMREGTSSSTLNLGVFTEQLKEADHKIDFNKVYSLYKEFLSFEQSDAFWEEEANRTGAIKWGRSWKDAVGGHLFLNVAVNEPHMSLIATVLQELLGARLENWEEMYEECRQKVAQIIRTHPYFRRRTGLYALGAAYTFNHPIGQLLFTEALDQLETEEDKRDLAKAKPVVAFKFNSSLNRSFKGALEEFIKQYPKRIEDLQGDDLSNPDKLREYADFGLPHYRILLAECLQKRINWSHLGREEVGKAVKEFFPYYLEAGVKGDFEGYFQLSTLVGIGIEDNKRLKKTSFIQGNGKSFEYFHSESKSEKEKLEKLLDNYALLKRFLTPAKIKKEGGRVI